MSLLKTKPNYAPNCVATASGWTNPVTGEVLVAIGNLKVKLKEEKAEKAALAAAEKKLAAVQTEKKAAVVVAPPVVVKNKVLVKENFKKSPEKGQVLIGEVVEFPIVDGAVVIGE